MLDAEMDEHLGYEKNSVEGNTSRNSRNGYGKKTIKILPEVNEWQNCPHKDRKEICADLKKIYGTINLDDAEYAKEKFREKWDKKYPNILKSWDKNWAQLTVFFEYPAEIRKDNIHYKRC